MAMKNLQIYLGSLLIMLILGISGYSQTQVNLIVHDVSCPGAQDGSMSLQFTGGIIADSAYWSTGALGNQIDSLAPGVYSVTIILSPVGTIVLQDTIQEPAELIVVPLAVNPTDSLSNGSVQLICNGGTPPYTFDWSNGLELQTLSQLAAGTYVYTVTDAHGCTIIDSLYLDSQNTPTGNLISYFSITHPSCPGLCDGSIDLTVLGGIQPYQFVWSNGASTQDVSGLCPGSYVLTVLGSGSFPINLPFPWTYTNTGVNHSILISNGNVSVNGLASPIGSFIGVFYQDNGALRCGGFTQLSGGNVALPAWGDDLSTPIKDGFSEGELLQWFIYYNGNSYPLIPQYNLNNDQGFYTDNGISVLTQLVGQVALINSITFPELIAGSFADSVHITPANPTYNSSGAIDLSVIGGHPPYSFQWSNGLNSQDLLNAPYGNYQVTITDSLGCVIEDSVFVDFSILPDWNLIAMSGQTHQFIMDSLSYINLKGFDLPYNSFVGAFYDSAGTLTCGGYAVLRGGSKTISLASNSQTLDVGEEIQWKFWSSQNYEEHDAWAIYDETYPSAGSFDPGGLSRIDSLQSVSIDGTVQSTSTLLVPWGEVHAYRYRADDFQWIKSAPFQDGFFSISSLPPGNYILQFVPESNLFLTSYCLYDYHWAEADMVNAYGYTTGLEIMLDEAQTCPLDCPCSIQGKLIGYESFIANASIPLPIVLYNEFMQPLRFVQADENGDFQFTSLMFGHYFLRAEIVGIETPVFEVELSLDKPNVNGIQYTLSNDNLISDLGLWSVYPNPANDAISIVSPKDISKDGLLQIYSADGRFVKGAKFLSSQSFNIDVNDLESGVYFIKLIYGQGNSILRFVKR